MLSPDDSSAAPVASEVPVTAPAAGSPATNAQPTGQPTDLPGPKGGPGPDPHSSMNHQDVFEPVATNSPPANIKTRHDHPVKNLHVSFILQNHSGFVNSNFLTRPIHPTQLRPTNSMLVSSSALKRMLVSPSHILLDGRRGRELSRAGV